MSLKASNIIVNHKQIILPFFVDKSLIILRHVIAFVKKFRIVIFYIIICLHVIATQYCELEIAIFYITTLNILQRKKQHFAITPHRYRFRHSTTIDNSLIYQGQYHLLRA